MGPMGPRGPQGERGPAGTGGAGTPRYAIFQREEELAVPNGGGSVPLSSPRQGEACAGEDEAAEGGGVTLQSEDISCEDGAVRLPGPGVYHLMYHVNFPVAARVRTVLSLQMDGMALPGSVCHVDKENPGQPFTAMGQAIVRVGEPRTVTLHSSRGFVITAAAAGDTLAALTVVGIS